MKLSRFLIGIALVALASCGDPGVEAPESSTGDSGEMALLTSPDSARPVDPAAPRYDGPPLPGMKSPSEGPPDRIEPPAARESSPARLSELRESMYSALRTKAERDGAARVIAKLRGVAHMPLGNVSAAQAAAQKAAIGRAQQAVEAAMAGRNIHGVKKFSTIPYIAMGVDADALEALYNDPNVEAVYESRQNKPSLAEATILTGAVSNQNVGFTGTGWTVAILDTGVDKTHAFLAGKVVSEACYSTNWLDNGYSSICPGGADTTAAGSGVNCNLAYDGCSHGTHVAGISAGKDPGGLGYNGVAKEASVIAIQVFTYDDWFLSVTAFDDDIILGLERVFALRGTYNIAAANMSLGGGSSSSYCDSADPAMKAAIDNLRSANIATVIASGNNGWVNKTSYPSCISSAVSVGSSCDSANGYCSASNKIAGYSNLSSIVSLLAPGSLITSSTPGNSYASWHGTSMATPMVTGAWAQMMQAKPTATVSQVVASFQNTGVSIKDMRSGATVTKKRIDVYKAAGNLMGAPGAATLTAPPASTPDTTPTYQWNEVAKATWYRVLVHDAVQNNKVDMWVRGVDVCAGGVCSYTSATALAFGPARFWLMTYNSGGDGPWIVRDFNVGDPPPGAVTLTAPSGTIADSTPTYQWNEVAGAERYYLWVNDSTQVGKVDQNYATADVCAGGVCSATPATALANGACRFWMRPWSAAGGYGPWTVLNFTVDVPPPGAVTLTAPSGTIADSTPTYTWNEVAGADRYYLWVNNGGVTGKVDQNYAAADVCAGGLCSATPATALVNGPSRFWMRPWSAGAGYGPWSLLEFTVSVAPPAAPVLISPVGAINDSTPTYRWNEVAGADRYALWVNNPKVNGTWVTGKVDKTYNAADVCVGGVCTATPNVSLSNGDGKFWLQAFNGAGASQWAGLDFSVNVVAPGAVTLTAPSGTINDSTPTYTWNELAGADRYYMWVNDPTKVGKVDKVYWAADVCVGGVCSATPTTALATGSCRFWMYAANGAGNGPWSLSPFVLQ